MIESIDNHPLTNNEVSSNWKRWWEKGISQNTDKCSKSKSIAHMSFKKCNIVFIIRPFSKIVEGSVKEAIHNCEHPRKVFLIEETANNQEKTNGHVKSHFEYKWLYSVAGFSYCIKFFLYIKFRHHFFCLFSFPNYNLLSQLDCIHVVKTQINVGPN